MTSLWLSLVLSGLLTEPGRGDGITVVGNGEVSAKPSLVEFRTRVAGTGELGSDATVKYLDAKRRTLAAIEQLKKKELKVEVGGISVGSVGPNPNEGVPRAAGQPPGIVQIQFSSMLRLALGGIQDMPEETLMQEVSQLLDRLRDSGLDVMPAADEETEFVLDEADEGDNQTQPVAMFVLEDGDELREQAYRQAFAAARSNAARLARLAGAKLGPVLAIEEISAPAMQVGGYSGRPEFARERDSLRLASHRFAPIRMRVSLQVRFGIEK